MTPSPKKKAPLEPGDECVYRTTRHKWNADKLATMPEKIRTEKHRVKIEALNTDGDAAYISYIDKIQGEWVPLTCLRRLSPKRPEKPERLERWITGGDVLAAHRSNATVYLSKEEYIGGTRLVELRSGEVPVSREALERAVDKAASYFAWVQYADRKPYCEKLLEILGLPEKESP